MSTYTIGEAAERSGFTVSALRYYEGIGLVEPTARSDAGYRLYGERALDRLAFIARAKQLGCSLPEITDLLAIWDGEQCGPVQRRFHELVTEKISAAQRQSAELVALTAQLQRAAAQLGAVPVDGPCDEGCACVRATPVPPINVAVALGTASSEPSIECTLEPGAMPDRLGDWQRVLDGATARVAAPGGGIRVELGEGADLAELVGLAAAEQRCCAFFSFRVTIDGRGVGLEVQGPEGASAMLASLFGQPAA